MSTREESTPSAPTPTSTAPSRKRRRRLIRLIAILILLLAAVAAVQVVLMTDLPRRLALARLQKVLGLRITAAELRTGWLGHTTLRDVAISMPLGDEPFLTIPNMEVDHTNLVGLLLPPVPLEVHRVQLRQPLLRASQDAGGTWDIQEALALVARAIERESARRGARHMALPDVFITEGRIVLTDRLGRTADLAPLEFAGQSASAVAWDFRTSIADLLSARGRIAPGQDWTHLVEFSLQQVDRHMRPWLPDPPALTAEGVWSGKAGERGVAGRLDLANLLLGRYQIRGAVLVEQRNGQLVAIPHSLAVAGQDLPDKVTIDDGTLLIAPPRIQIMGLRLACGEGKARLQGELDWNTPAGRADLAWADLPIPAGTRHGGSLNLALAGDWHNRLELTARLNTAGKTAEGEWVAQIESSARGTSWIRTDWQMILKDARWTGRPFAFGLHDIATSVSLQLERDARRIRLTSLRRGQTDQLAARGEYNIDNGDWRVIAAARDLPLPRTAASGSLKVSASGRGRRADVFEFEADAGELHASGSGRYWPDDAAPLQVSLRTSRLPLRVSDPQRRILASGAVAGEFSARGVLWPVPRVTLGGEVAGQEIVLGRRQIGEVRAVLTGEIGEQASWVRTGELRLLDGQWEIIATHDHGTGATTAQVRVQDLPLTQVGLLLDPSQALRGELTAELSLTNLAPDPTLVNVAGRWQVKQLAAGDFRAERVAGNLAMRDRTLALNDIELRQEDGTASARVEARFTDLKEMPPLTVSFTARQWPVTHPDLPVQALITASSPGLRINTRRPATTQPAATQPATRPATRPAIVGPLIVDRALILHNGGQVAAVTADLQFDDATLVVRGFSGEALDGRFDGSARVNLDNWPQSDARLAFDDLDAQKIGVFWPAARDLRGRYRGTIAATRPTVPYPTAPLQVDVSIESRDGGFRDLAVGDFRATLLAGTDRLVLRDSSMRLADGQAALWARLSRHEKSWISLLIVEFTDLALPQIVRTAAPDAEPMLGRLSGRAEAVGPILEPARLSGRASIRLSEANLINSDIIGSLLTAMGKRPEPAAPTGQGTFRVRIEDGKLLLQQGVYRNHGVEIYAAQFRVLDLFTADDWPISGYVVGSARPIRDIKLPFMDDLDDLLHALQGTITTMKVEGTVRKPTVTPATLSELGGSVRDILLNEPPGP